MTLLTALLWAFTSTAQPDSLVLSLDSTRVVAVVNTSQLKGKLTETLTWDMAQISLLPKVLGTADPLHYASMLPGVQTNSEFNGGIHILGSETSHNDVRLGGVPVYGANHLFGLYSVFNSTHFPTATFALRTPTPTRLGGLFDMNLPDVIPDGTQAEGSVGLIASQVTIRSGKGNSAFFASARTSHLNTFYKGLMEMDGDPIRYHFGDYNISWLWSPGKRDKLWVNAYAGRDEGSIREVHFDALVDSRWGNSLASARWMHDFGNMVMDQTVFATGFRTAAAIDQEVIKLKLPSQITTYGYRGELKRGVSRLFLDISLHDVSPQTPEVSGNHNSGTVSERQKGAEIVPGVSTGGDFGLSTSWTAGLSIPWYISPEKESRVHLSPEFRVSHKLPRYGTIAGGVSMKYQHLFQTGFSDIGLPIEFWFLAGRHSDPQAALSGNLSYELDIKGGAYHLSADAYCSGLSGQVDYGGTLFDLIDTEYNLDRMLLKGRGINYGTGIILSKRSGDLTGWISYSWARALRRFESLSPGRYYPADHERPHELDAVATYRLGKWDFGGSFVAASGTPVTHPDFLYLASGQILAKYREHNSSRMRPYIRMDLSANWNFIRTEHIEAGLNLSVYNVMDYRNDVCYRLTLRGDEFRYGNLTSFMHFIPSTSLYFKIR